MFGKGGDIDVEKRWGMGRDVLKRVRVRRRSEAEGQRGWGSADHPRTV